MVDMFHVLLPKATWLQTQITRLLQVVVHPVAQKMVMANQNHHLAALVTMSQNLLHAELVIVTRNPQHVVQVKVIVNLRHQLVAPHAEPEASKEFYFPGTILTGTGNFLNSTQNLWNTLLFSGI